MKTLDKLNIDRLKRKLKVRWQITADHWFPIDEYDIDEEVVYFPQNYFFQDYGLENLKILISELEDNYIYQWNWETGKEDLIKIKVSEMVEFKNLEKFYFDIDCKWIIYISHENTIAFGGKIIIEKLIDKWENWFKYLNKWEVD